jgi:hypothetical protein
MAHNLKTVELADSVFILVPPIDLNGIIQNQYEERIFTMATIVFHFQ